MLDLSSADTTRNALTSNKVASLELRHMLESDPRSVGVHVETYPPKAASRLLLEFPPRLARQLLANMDGMKALMALAELKAPVVSALVDKRTEVSILENLKQEPSVNQLSAFSRLPKSLWAELHKRYSVEEDALSVLTYDSDQVGSVMEQFHISAEVEETLGQLIERIRQNSETISRLFDIFVVNSAEEIVGYLRPRDLVLHDAGIPVSEIMSSGHSSIPAGTLIADAADLLNVSSSHVVGVVDEDGRLLGRLTPSSIAEITRAKYEEVAKISSGLSPKTSQADGPIRNVLRRLPWLIAGLLGAGTAAFVVGAYEDALTEAAILASLIPIVMSLAGNAGIQASTVTVQAQTTGGLWIGNVRDRVLHEALGAMLNGLIVGAIVGIAIMGVSQLTEIDRPMNLAAAALMTLVLVTIQASVIGSIIPILLGRLGFDPAVATGVFITTSNDVVGVLIFFVIATAIYV